MKNFISTLTLVSLLSCGMFAQSPGSLDPTFNQVGYRADVTQDTIRSSEVDLMPDGRIVASGISENGPDRLIHVFRYHVNGNLDTTFAHTGHVIVHGPKVQSDYHDATLQADGKILLYYQAPASLDGVNVVGRLNLDGTMDATFGNGGWVLDSTNYPIGYPNEVIVQPDGKILLTGRYTDENVYTDGFYVQRLLPSGMPDLAYGTAGYGYALTPAFSLQCIAAELQPDGKLLFAGYTYDTLSFVNHNAVLGRVNSNGTTDTGFGTNGYVWNTTVPLYEFAKDVAIGLQGEIYVAADNPNSTQGQDYNLVQFSSAGVLNTNFGTGGWIEISDGFNDLSIQAIEVQADGGVLTLSIGSDIQGNTEVPNLIRLTPSFVRDPNFGTNGLANPVLNNQGLSPDAMALQADGAIVVAGTSSMGWLDGNMTVARYNGLLALAAEPAIAAATIMELYPNPNAGLAQMRLTFPASCEVTVRLCDMLGRTVAQPCAHQTLTAGTHVMTVDAQALPAGTYLLHVQTDAQVQTQRMVVTH